MAPQRRCATPSGDNYDFFLGAARGRPRDASSADVKGTQFLQPLFEYSGACAGCGETPYLKLLTQLFGDRAADRQRHRLLVDLRRQPADHAVHARTPTAAGRPGPTRCSRTTPSSASACGWRSTSTQARARELLRRAGAVASATTLADALLDADQRTEAGIAAQRERVAALRQVLAGRRRARRARGWRWLADYLVTKSVWIVGGDGWAYDIGFGGLDHVLALGRNVNILVLDTEVYSNTGGQQSKATPLGAAAKFAAAGKATGKKDLGADGDELRQRLRRAGRLRRQGRADGQGVPGGRGAIRARR